MEPGQGLTRPDSRPNIVTLLTDFGTSDGYVAAMKGVILAINPTATIVDISHEIPPQDIHAGAFVLSQCHSAFPPGAVHVVVVDPGVGSSRRAVVVATPNAYFVAPDNGVLSEVVNPYLAVSNPPEPGEAPSPARRLIPTPLRAWALDDPSFFLPRISNTFHGRDVFAPVAARLAAGTPVETVGPAAGDLAIFQVAPPRHHQDGSITGTVVHIDRFGNLITNVMETEIELPSSAVTVSIGGRTISGLSQSYTEGGDLLALIGSSGRLEVAAKNGSAAGILGIDRWSLVHIRSAQPAGANN